MIDFDNTIFNIDIPGGKPDIGALLISEPFLREDYFHHSVICIADYAPDSTAMGIVLNRLTGYTLQNIIEAVREYVNLGYPLEGYLRFFLGYSGWSRLQLDEEISNRVWAVTESTDYSSMLTGSEDPYWHRYVRMLGKRFRGWRFHPRNPHAN